jgi:hypothetical protein
MAMPLEFILVYSLNPYPQEFQDSDLKASEVRTKKLCLENEETNFHYIIFTWFIY